MNVTKQVMLQYFTCTQLGTWTPKGEAEKGVAEQPQAGSSLHRNWGAGGGQAHWEDPVAPHASPRL